MNHVWQVERDGVVHPDGQRRWDRAYQLLLQLADGPLAAPEAPSHEEDEHAHRSLYPRLDESSTADPHD